MNDGETVLPVLIASQSHVKRLVKKDNQDLVILRNLHGKFHFEKVISKYAVNTAAYAANCVVQEFDYHEVLAIGVNSWPETSGQWRHEIAAYLLTTENPELPLFITEATDLSFLKRENVRPFFQKINEVLEAPEELHRRAIRDETRLDMVLKHLNQTLHDQNGILPRYRIFVVSASLLASIGVQHRGSDDEVPPLDPQELTGECAPGQTDGDKIFKKVQAALHACHLPDAKIKQIMSVLEGTLVSNNLNTKETDGMTAVAKIYCEIYDELRPTYLTADISDFTGCLFNVMNSWVDVPDGGANDVVLTPRYITDLMARICTVDMNSYVWDWALGSCGFLISAMHLMLRDAHAQLKNDPEAYQRKISEIKTSQLLGVELLPDIYMLAVLNMILVGDGSTNIVNADAINGYDATYAYDKSKKFKANVFLLNPPYSAEGNGLIFVQKAFEQMSSGMGAVIIQDSAGAGRAMAISQRILKHNRLVASIRMPNDLFKASVQTSIYVFKVGEPDQANDQVRFVDFSNDGYLRTHRKKPFLTYEMLITLTNATRNSWESSKEKLLNPSIIHLVKRILLIRSIRVPGTTGIMHNIRKTWPSPRRRTLSRRFMSILPGKLPVHSSHKQSRQRPFDRRTNNCNNWLGRSKSPAKNLRSKSYSRRCQRKNCLIRRRISRANTMMFIAYLR